MKTPLLSSIPSTGPKVIKWRMDGHEYTQTHATPCEFCKGPIAEGAEISYFRGAWVHARCAADSLITGGADSAWLALGSDLARHPRAYRTAETRLIVNQLLRIAAGMQPDDVDFEESA